MAERLLGQCVLMTFAGQEALPEEKVRWVGWGEDGLATSGWCILREGLSQGG